MTIGFDGKEAVKGAPEEERTVALIERLATDYPDVRILVYTPVLTKRNRLRRLDDLHNVEYRVPAPSGFKGSMWRTFGITNCLRADKVDIYHGVNGVLPLNIAAAHVPSVVSAGFPSDKSIVSGGGLWLRRRWECYIRAESLLNATRIIVVGEDAGDMLSSGDGVTADKIDFLREDFSCTELMEIYLRAIALFNG